MKDEFEMPVKAERKFMHFWNESMENNKNYDVLKMIDNYHLMLLGALPSWTWRVYRDFACFWTFRAGLQSAHEVRLEGDPLRGAEAHRKDRRGGHRVRGHSQPIELVAQSNGFM